MKKIEKRFQLLLSDEELKNLKEEAEKRSITASELLRIGLHNEISKKNISREIECSEGANEFTKMKILISEEVLNKLIFTDSEEKKKLEKSLSDMLKKNDKFYISSINLKNICDKIPKEKLDKLLINIELLTEKILPFNLEVLKLSFLLKSDGNPIPIESATAIIFGIDKILNGDLTYFSPVSK